MPRVTVDFSQVEEFEPVEEGDYEAEITNVEFREASSDDKFDYLNVEYTIREDGEFQGQKVWGIWSMSPKALWRMKQAWEELGILGEDDEINIDYDEDTMEVTEPELAGLPCVVTVVQESYEGRTRSRAEGVTALDAPPKREEKKSSRAKKEEADEEQPPEEEEKKPARSRAKAGASSGSGGRSRRKFQ